METAEIRRRWLRYFSSRGHTVVPSAPLLYDDPTLLFVNAGMVPFKPYFLGQESAPYRRATSVQKCLRTLDIEEVGKTSRHGTFFQMNGNFSFGDYFKEGAIELAWELVTRPQSDGGFGYAEADLWVTVLHDDEESIELWKRVAGVPAERIVRRGLKDNYWHMGVPGPGGPCSEIYVDRGPEHGPEGGPAVDEDRFLEIWNLVFMQDDLSAVRAKDDFDIRGELPAKNIDTGMGLERVAYLLQGVQNLYEIDEVYPVIARVEEVTGRRYGARHEDDVRMRVVADHVRSGLMLMADGVTPANDGRGYVLRRLLRRAIRSVRLLGVEDPMLTDLLEVSQRRMVASYPELEQAFGRVRQVAEGEEDSFRHTLTAGTTIFDTAVRDTRKSGSEVLSGQRAFQLHDTYGFPIDLTLEMAAEQGLQVDEGEFRRLDARAARSGQGRRQAEEDRSPRHQRLPRRRGRAGPGGRVHRLRRGRLAGPGGRAAGGRRARARRPGRVRGRGGAGPHPVLRRGRRPARRRRGDRAGRRADRGRRRAVPDHRGDRAPGPGGGRRGAARRACRGPGGRRPAQVDQPRAHRHPHGAQGDQGGARRHRDPGRLRERPGPVPVRLPRGRRAAAERAARRRGAGERAAGGGPRGARRRDVAGAGPCRRRPGAVRGEVRRPGPGGLGRRLGPGAVRRHARPPFWPARPGHAALARARSAPGCAGWRRWSGRTPTGSPPASTCC